jgi:hypothetical protein
MKSSLLKHILVVFILVVAVVSTQAQQKRFRGHYTQRKSVHKFLAPGNLFLSEKFSLYGGLGLSSYYGDLCEKWECMQFRMNLGGGAQYRTDYLGTRLSFRTEFNYFRLHSNDVLPDVRNLSFRSGNFEGYVGAVYDLFPYEKHFRRRPLVSPYFFAGLGFLYFNPHGELNGKWYALQPLETEGHKYHRMAAMYNFGSGLRFRYTYNIEFVLEGGYRYTTTDHLDDVSAYNYASPSTFTDPIALALSKKTTYNTNRRGNPSNRDGYFIFVARFRYTFGKPNVAKFRGKQHMLRKH